MVESKKVEKAKELIEELGFDYQRMSGSGQITYNQICKLLGIEVI